MRAHPASAHRVYYEPLCHEDLRSKDIHWPSVASRSRCVRYARLVYLPPGRISTGIGTKQHVASRNPQAATDDLSCCRGENKQVPRPVNHLLLALGAMFLQQTFVSLGRSLPAVIAPAIITDLQLAPAWIGVYFGLTALASLVVQLGCGSFIVRHGALRMSQIALVLLAAGTALATLGTPLALCCRQSLPAAAAPCRHPPVRICLRAAPRRVTCRWCFPSSRPRCRPACCSPASVHRN